MRRSACSESTSEARCRVDPRRRGDRHGLPAGVCPFGLKAAEPRRAACGRASRRGTAAAAAGGDGGSFGKAAAAGPRGAGGTAAPSASGGSRRAVVVYNALPVACPCAASPRAPRLRRFQPTHGSRTVNNDERQPNQRLPTPIPTLAGRVAEGEEVAMPEPIDYEPQTPIKRRRRKIPAVRLALMLVFLAFAIPFGAGMVMGACSTR